MLKFLSKILASKIGKILIDIALSGVGKILQDLLDTTINAMTKAEDIGEQFVYFSSSLKGLGKFSIAFDIIQKDAKNKGNDYEEYIINFAIEMIFIKYFKG